MRVLIVDDHPIVASGCRALMADDAELVILDAPNAETGLEVFLAERPDVSVLDINLPGVSGFELAKRMLAREACARIIMFSMNEDPIFAARAIECGARGYVSKSGDPADLVSAIREVGDGRVFLPSAIAQSIAFARLTPTGNRLAKLTPREIEILRLLGTGKSLAEIAWMINASYKTIANNSSIIRQKLGVRTSSELVRFAIQSQLA
ncbi:response regulator [Bradyrhizobium sp.]|uniref:response regulator n=1 Tax=Bradyrhizobium sp. TaxID=376 RepID=UPI004037F8B7